MTPTRGSGFKLVSSTAANARVAVAGDLGLFTVRSVFQDADLHRSARIEPDASPGELDPGNDLRSYPHRVCDITHFQPIRTLSPRLFITATHTIAEIYIILIK